MMVMIVNIIVMTMMGVIICMLMIKLLAMRMGQLRWMFPIEVVASHVGSRKVGK